MRKPAGNPSGKLVDIDLMGLGRLALSMLFLAAIYLFMRANPGGTGVDSTLLMVAAIIGGYMALNIGANDVANNVGPAVGAGALTLLGAILIAVIFEAGGAIIAGGDVVKTIKKGIIDPSMIPDTQTFIWVMTAALLSGCHLAKHCYLFRRTCLHHPFYCRRGFGCRHCCRRLEYCRLGPSTKDCCELGDFPGTRRYHCRVVLDAD